MYRGADKLSPLSLEILLGLFYFFYFAIVGIYVIFLPKVLLQFGYSEINVGIIFGAAPLMRFLVPFLFRRYISLDNRAFVISLLLLFLSLFLFFFTINHFVFFLIANLFFGAAMGVVLPFVETISLENLARNRYGKIRLFGSIGFMIIALWLGKVLSNPFDALYYLFVVGFFTMLFGVAMVSLDSNTKMNTTGENRDFSLMVYPWFWISLFLMQVGFGGFYNFFTIYETSHGVTLGMVSLMWSFGVVAEIVMLYYQGALLQKNLLSIISLSILITSIRWMLLYLYPTSIAITFASQALHAVSFALYHSATITYVFLLYRQKKLAQQFLLGVAYGLGGAVGAILAGQLYGSRLFLFESLVTLLSLVAFLLHMHRFAKMQQHSHVSHELP